MYCLVGEGTTKIKMIDMEQIPSVVNLAVW